MNTVVNFLATESGWLLYTILFVMIILENAVPIVPGDTFLAFSAYLVGVGALRPYFTFFLTILAAVIGFFIIYIVAYFWGRTFFDKKKYRALSPQKMAKIDRQLHRHGYWVLAIGRFIPGTRFLVAFMAGFTRLKFIPATLFISAGILGWNFMIFILGKLAGENRAAIAHFISKYNHIASGVALIILAIFIVWRVNLKSRKLESRISD